MIGRVRLSLPSITPRNPCLGLLPLGVLCLGAISLLAMGQPACAGWWQEADLEQQFEDLLQEHKLPGAVVARYRAGQPEILLAVGVRKKGAPNALTIDNKMHIGSCTKAMTAALLATLVEEGKLSWDTTLSACFPEKIDLIHADYQPVTLRQLLSHRAGTPQRFFWLTLKGESTAEKRDDLFQRVLSTEPPIPPGSRFAYSNAGYVFAGMMAEKVTGKDWETLMRERIFAPLKMDSVGFGIPDPKQQVEQPWGHLFFINGYVTNQFDNPPALGPAGRVHCNLDDWSKFAHLFTTAGRAKNPVLAESSIEQLVTVPDDSERYALGWGVIEPQDKGPAIYSHSGSNTRWYSKVSVRDDMILLVAINAAGERAEKFSRAAERLLIKAERQKHSVGDQD